MTIALSYAPPIAFGALRTGGAAAFMFVVLAACGKSLRMPTGLGSMAPLGLFETTAFVGLITLARYQGDAGRIAIRVSTMPCWVLVPAAPVLGERFTWAKLVAGACGLARVVMLFSPWTIHGDLLGMALAAAAGLAWAVAVMIAKRIAVRGVWALLSLNAWQILIGAIPLGIVGCAARGLANRLDRGVHRRAPLQGSPWNQHRVVPLAVRALAPLGERLEPGGPRRSNCRYPRRLGPIGGAPGPVGDRGLRGTGCRS
jgi:hypothetical protein